MPRFLHRANELINLALELIEPSSRRAARAGGGVIWHYGGRVIRQYDGGMIRHYGGGMIRHYGGELIRQDVSRGVVTRR
jgi:hypothetical protein